jgi:hypothetical protein
MAGNVTVYREIGAALAAEPRHGHSADHVIAA